MEMTEQEFNKYRRINMEEDTDVFGAPVPPISTLLNDAEPGTPKHNAAEDLRLNISPDAGAMERSYVELLIQLTALELVVGQLEAKLDTILVDKGLVGDPSHCFTDYQAKDADFQHYSPYAQRFDNTAYQIYNLGVRLQILKERIDL